MGTKEKVGDKYKRKDKVGNKVILIISKTDLQDADIERFKKKGKK